MPFGRGSAMKKVATYGTFDLLHLGHLRLLERLHALGDHLTVFVSSDEFSTEKGKVPTVPHAERIAIVGSLRCVDEVYTEFNWDQKILDIQRFEIHTLGMGDDWIGKFDFLSPFCEVVYLPRTDGISSTIRRAQIIEAAQI